LPLNLTDPLLARNFSKMCFVRRSLILAMLIWAAGSSHPTAAQQSRVPDNQPLESVSVKTEIYSANADANQEIQEALKRAVSEKKRVLLVFGANWCYDCHVLDRALHEGAAGQIVAQHFLIVHVDIGEGEKNGELLKTYRIPLERGVPAVAVLGNDGKLLFSSGNGEFEAARSMLKKDLVGFLNHWSPEERRQRGKRKL
jgi:thiol:disulfide interchange protein